MTNAGLYRSNQSNMIAGVLGGVAERFGWNTNLLRFIFVLVSIMSAAFPGILVYLILWMIMPKRPVRTMEHTAGSNYRQPIRTIYEDQHLNR